MYTKDIYITDLTRCEKMSKKQGNSIISQDTQLIRYYKYVKGLTNHEGTTKFL